MGELEGKKVPWGDGTPWPKSVNWFTYLRGCLRKAWSNNPIKIILINKKRRQIPNPNPKGKKETVWGFDCEMCNGVFTMSECQVDHKVPAGKLSSIEDIQGFVERLLFVTEDDLRLVCKSCNNALALAEKQGITYEEAVKQKQIISILNQKKEKEVIDSFGVTPESSKAKRRQQLEKLFSQDEVWNKFFEGEKVF